MLLIVSRLTAAAAADRDDLVFPLDQYRDDTGTVVGAAGLGAYAPKRRRRWGRGRPGKNRLLAHVDKWSIRTLETATAIALTAGTALAGAALGIPPDLAVEGWTPVTGRIWMLVIFSVSAAASLIGGVGLLRARLERRRRFGTAYLVEETAGDWTVEEKKAFVGGLNSRFAVVLRVPGPARRGSRSESGGRPVRWAWQTDSEAASRWSERLDDLVHAFWTTHFNDDEESGNAVFVWAPWPVAMAFGGRASAGRRWAGLRVGQRPSRGRAGVVEPIEAAQQTWSFRVAEKVEDITLCGTWVERTYGAELRVAAEPNTDDRGEYLVLVIRLNSRPWGPLPAITDPSETDATHPPLTITVTSPSELVSSGRARLEEFRYLGKDDQIGWREFPAVVTAAAEWVERRCADAEPTTTVLLGMAAPQEIAVGLGIHAADERRTRWPAHLWPLIWQPHRRSFVIPDLDLGSTQTRRTDPDWG